MPYQVQRYSASCLARMVDLAAYAVALAFDVEPQDVKSAKRDQDICAARHLVIYVSHVALGMSFNEIAHVLGRDRTTAVYACRVIEDRRDEPAFDERVRVIECALSYFRGLEGLAQ